MYILVEHKMNNHNKREKRIELNRTLGACPVYTYCVYNNNKLPFEVHNSISPKYDLIIVNRLLLFVLCIYVPFEWIYHITTSSSLSWIALKTVPIILFYSLCRRRRLLFLLRLHFPIIFIFFFAHKSQAQHSTASSFDRYRLRSKMLNRMEWNRQVSSDFFSFLDVRNAKNIQNCLFIVKKKRKRIFHLKINNQHSYDLFHSWLEARAKINSILFDLCCVVRTQLHIANWIELNEGGKREKINRNRMNIMERSTIGLLTSFI